MTEIIHKEEAQEQTVPNQRGVDGPTRQAPAETRGWMEIEHEGLCGAWSHSSSGHQKSSLNHRLGSTCRGLAWVKLMVTHAWQHSIPA